MSFTFRHHNGFSDVSDGVRGVRPAVPQVSEDKRYDTSGKYRRGSLGMISPTGKIRRTGGDINRCGTVLPLKKIGYITESFRNIRSTSLGFFGYSDSKGGSCIITQRDVLRKTSTAFKEGPIMENKKPKNTHCCSCFSSCVPLMDSDTGRFSSPRPMEKME